MSILSEILIAVGYKVDKQPLEDAEKAGVDSAQKTASAWSRAGPMVGKAILGIGVAAGAAATGLLALVERSTASADAIAKGARAAGEASDSFQRLSFVAGRSGVGPEVLTKAIQNVGKFMEETRDKGVTPFAEALDKVGLSMRDLEGLDTETRLGVLSDALLTVEDTGKRAAIAQKLLGEEAGPKLASFVELGLTGIRELGDEAERLGYVLSEDALNASESFQDSMSDLKGSVGALARDIGVSLAPEIQGVVEDVTDWVAVNGDLLRQDIGMLGHELAGGLRAALPVIRNVIDAITTMAQTTQGVILMVEDAQAFFGGEDHQKKRAQNERILADFQGRMAGASGAHLQAQLDTQTDPRLRNVIRREIERRTGIVEDSSAEVTREGMRLARRSGGGGGGGGGGGSGRSAGGAAGSIDVGAMQFEALDMFGDDLDSFGAQVGATPEQIEEAVIAAARALEGHASEKVARQAGVSRLESLTGSKIKTHDPSLEQLLGPMPAGVPPMQLSEMSGGLEPQVLVNTNNINNSFDIDIVVDGASDPSGVAGGIAQQIRQEMTDVFNGAARQQQVNFAR